MLTILLPPSESKAAPETGPVLDLDSLSFRTLTRARDTVLRGVSRTVTTRGAAAALKIPATQPELLTRMSGLRLEPTAPVLEVYTGVLYDALGAARPSAGHRVLVTSALLGLVDASVDRIPAYRLSAGSSLSRLGTVGPWWRQHLAAIGRHVASESTLVLDCRSGSYRSMMPVTGAIEVAAVREVAGRRTVVSHDAKRYRGIVARAVLEARTPPSHVEDIAHLAERAFAGRAAIEVTTGQLTVVERG